MEVILDAQTSAPAGQLSRRRFSVRQLMVFILLFALPLAFFSEYYRIAADTVDGYPVPLANIKRKAIPFAALVVATAVFAVAFYVVRLRTALVLSVIGFLLIPTLRVADQSLLQLVDPFPRRTNPLATLHNDAMTKTVVAVREFVECNNGKWPSSWDDLERIDPTLDVDSLSKIVDIHFSVDPNEVAKQKWYEFTAIRPHKPCYNFYRIELQQLIRGLSGAKDKSVATSR